MNQILYTGKKKSKGPAPLKSIIRFFSISLIILGLIFVGNGSYALYQNNILSKKELNYAVPKVAFEQEGNNAIVTVTHDKGISKVKYHWNEDTDTIINAYNEQTVILDDISIIPGKNKLYVTVIDINGQSTENSFEYTYDGISIELQPYSDASIKIIASDVKGLSYITYKWNSEKPITAYVDPENPNVIEQTTELPKGLNSLSVTAVNSENKTLTKTQEYKGVHPPQIQLFMQDNQLIVKVTDDEGLKQIKNKINDEQEQIVDLNGEKEYIYRCDLSNKGDVLVTITATNIEDLSKTVKGKNW